MKSVSTLSRRASSPACAVCSETKLGSVERATSRAASDGKRRRIGAQHAAHEPHHAASHCDAASDSPSPPMRTGSDACRTARFQRRSPGAPEKTAALRHLAMAASYVAAASRTSPEV